MDDSHIKNDDDDDRQSCCGSQIYHTVSLSLALSFLFIVRRINHGKVESPEGYKGQEGS